MDLCIGIREAKYRIARQKVAPNDFFLVEALISILVTKIYIRTQGRIVQDAFEQDQGHVYSRWDRSRPPSLDVVGDQLERRNRELGRGVSRRPGLDCV